MPKNIASLPCSFMRFRIWKAKYYSRWVLPRALLIPGLRDPTASSENLRYSSKLSKWLDDGHLVKRGRETNWKRQYRLRHNWSKGSCRVSEVEVAQPPRSPVMVKYHKGIVITADLSNGLRAWLTKSNRSRLASISLDASEGNDAHPPPTAISVNIQDVSHSNIDVALGFEDGSFRVYSLDVACGRFILNFSHPASSNGAIIAMAFASPYILTMSENKTLSLYQFPSIEKGPPTNPHSNPPRLLSSLKSHNSWSSLSLSIRISRDEVIAGIAYAVPLINSWCIGLQELRLNKEGSSIGSRLTSTVEPQPAVAQLRTRLAQSDSSIMGKTFPNSVSYSHPYLLASHSDNTLSMYLVNSTATTLSIRTSRRLWGHTSAVSGVQVSDRGKAVSVSSRGGEIRIWELEDLVRRKTAGNYSSVTISPDKSVVPKQNLSLLTEVSKRKRGGLGLPFGERDNSESVLARGWVGFDDEQVLVLREHEVGTQLLHCYDFT